MRYNKFQFSSSYSYALSITRDTFKNKRKVAKPKSKLIPNLFDNHVAWQTSFKVDVFQQWRPIVLEHNLKDFSRYKKQRCWLEASICDVFDTNITSIMCRKFLNRYRHHNFKNAPLVSFSDVNF